MTRCFFCGEPDKILLAKHYTRDGKPLHDLEPLNDKVVDMDPCNKCHGHMNQGIMFIEIDHDKSEKNWDLPPDERHLPPEKRHRWIPNPYRTGRIAVIKEEAVKRCLDEETVDYLLKERWMFIDIQAAEEMGMFDPKLIGG